MEPVLNQFPGPMLLHCEWILGVYAAADQLVKPRVLLMGPWAELEVTRAGLNTRFPIQRHNGAIRREGVTLLWGSPPPAQQADRLSVFREVYREIEGHEYGRPGLNLNRAKYRIFQEIFKAGECNEPDALDLYRWLGRTLFRSSKDTLNLLDPLYAAFRSDWQRRACGGRDNLPGWFRRVMARERARQYRDENPDPVTLTRFEQEDYHWREGEYDGTSGPEEFESLDTERGLQCLSTDTPNSSLVYRGVRFRERRDISIDIERVLASSSREFRSVCRQLADGVKWVEIAEQYGIRDKKHAAEKVKARLFEPLNRAARALSVYDPSRGRNCRCSAQEWAMRRHFQSQKRRWNDHLKPPGPVHVLMEDGQPCDKWLKPQK